ncbi:hypothetical protein DRQ29_05495 [bacterium]|nr:MAG: hypothetical protein DRQ29_05495 [bacterium]
MSHVEEIQGARIENFTDACRTTYLNRNTGFQNLVVEQDVTGRATDVVDHNTADFKNTDGANINTNFKPNLHDMTIKEVVIGELQDFGSDMVDELVDETVWVPTGDNTAVNDGDSVILTHVDHTGGLYIYSIHFTSGTFEVGKIYMLTFVSSGVGTVLAQSAIPTDGTKDLVEGVNTYKYEHTGDNTYLRFQMALGTSLRINQTMQLKELTTKTQRTEYRVWKTNGDYLIDNVLQSGLGSELVTNGDFEDAANGWISMKEASGVGLTLDGEGYQTIVTEIGKTYKFSCDCDRKGVSPSISVKDKLPTGGSMLVIHPSGTDWNTYTGEFTALSLESVIHFGNGSNTALFDNVSIKIIALGTTPSSPDPSAYMVINNTAIIGYPDTRDAIQCQLKVYTDRTTAAEDLADYEEYMACRDAAITWKDESGNTYVDESNQPWKTI